MPTDLLALWEATRNCKFEAAHLGEPCETCTAIRLLLGTVAPKLPTVEQVNAEMCAQDPRAAFESFVKVQVYADAALAAAMMCYALAVTDLRRGELETDVSLMVDGFRRSLARTFEKFQVPVIVTTFDVKPEPGEVTH